ncbi:cytochrome c oxidase subunit 5b-2, mitochondrial-like [Tripterygium wilfordii]|uniref:cytochrome c oxidase subunit 5b-2, mitochondrial-like n=1 Tax=Tripterygium wilfordii TaxID=458696 RepID=UPI0018F807DA|nr:cytochrome c oxidase subunit 5b-2, mitochondrial-like [Tripterygium wilfordii]
MWRRVVTSSAASWRRPSKSTASTLTRRFLSSTAPSSQSPSKTPPFHTISSQSSPSAASASGMELKKKFEEMIPAATGHEREELEAELQGKRVLEINYPVGPFGTKEEPAIVKSIYDKRIVGCPGGEGEDEHDVVWFWLEKGKPHECPVCTQYFKLEVVGPGGPPHGHEDDHHH